MLANCSLCQEVGATVSQGVDLKENGEELFGTNISGVTANMADIEDKTIDDGRFIRPNDVDSAALVIVIGAELREKFFPNLDPIDKTIKVAGFPMRIVGVEQKRGSMFGNSLDNLAYVPITTYGRMFGRLKASRFTGKRATGTCSIDISSKDGCRCGSITS